MRESNSGFCEIVFDSFSVNRINQALEPLLSLLTHIRTTLSLSTAGTFSLLISLLLMSTKSGDRVSGIYFLIVLYLNRHRAGATSFTNDLTSSKSLQARAQSLVNAGAAATVAGASLVLSTAIDLIVKSRRKLLCDSFSPPLSHVNLSS